MFAFLDVLLFYASALYFLFVDLEVNSAVDRNRYILDPCKNPVHVYRYTYIFRILVVFF